MVTDVDIAKARLKGLEPDFAVEGGAAFQAIDELYNKLEEVKAAIMADDYRKASSLGYNEVSSAYIFLQRMLGSLITLDMKKDSIVSELAYELKVPYEKALELVSE